MEYVIVSIKGKQFKLKPGTQFTLPGSFGQVGQKIQPDAVLFAKDKSLNIGTPNLKMPLDLEIVSQGKSKKIDVATYRSKSRHRRHVGHRQETTTLKWTVFAPKKTKTQATKSA